MIKRTLAWVMTCCMLLSLIVVPGDASDKLNAWVDNDQRVMPGNPIDLNLNISGNPGLKVLTLRVYYENDKLECTAIDEFGSKEGTDKVPNIWDEFLNTTTRRDNVFYDSNPNDTSNNQRDTSKWSLASFNYTIDAASQWTTNGVLAKMTFKAKESVNSPVDATIDTEIIAATDVNDKRLDSGDMQGISAVIHIGENKPTHNVNVPANITSSPSNPVPEGETVTLTVAPATGYRLKEGTLKAEGAAGDLTKTGENTYTFTMGTSDVNVSAEFEPDVKTHDVKISPDIQNGQITSNPPNPVEENATVTLTVAPTTGYRLKEGTLKAEGAAGNLTKTGENTYTFTMGTSDVNVSAEFELIPPATHNVNVPVDIPNGKVTSSPSNPVAENAAVTLTVAPETGYRLKEGTLKAEGAAGELTKTGENTYTFTMGTSDVTVSAEFEPSGYGITVTCTPTEGGTAVPSKTTAQEGDVIELEVTPNTADGYVLDTLTVTDKEGKIEPTRSNAMTSGSSITYTFTVGKSDVKVEAKFIKPVPHQINILPSVPSEGGKVESDKGDTAMTDEQVKLTVTPDLNKGYVLKALTVKDSGGKDVPYMRINETTYAFSDYSFAMPDSDVTVQAEFGIPRLVSLPEKVEGGSVSSDKQPTAYVGETVTLTVTPDTNCQLKEGFPKVTKADGTAVTLTKADEKTYTFVMENSDATVSVEFVPNGEEITVTYAPGEGSGTPVTKTEKTPFKLPGNQGFTPPSNQSFDGWTLPDGKFYAVDAEISELANNSTITAHYKTSGGGGGCYVATAVYGSYDCPEVWTLRRFRDHVLAQTWYGRLFIKLYYAVSPTAVKLFGDSDWFQNFWRGKLDSMVSNLQADGFESTPYQDMDW